MLCAGRPGERPWIRRGCVSMFPTQPRLDVSTKSSGIRSKDGRRATLAFARVCSRHSPATSMMKSERKLGSEVLASCVRLAAISAYQSPVRSSTTKQSHKMYRSDPVARVPGVVSTVSRGQLKSRRRTVTVCQYPHRSRRGNLHPEPPYLVGRKKWRETHWPICRPWFRPCLHAVRKWNPT